MLSKEMSAMFDIGAWNFENLGDLHQLYLNDSRLCTYIYCIYSLIGTFSTAWIHRFVQLDSH